MVAMQTKRSEPGILYAFDASQFQGSGTTRDLVELWDSRQNQSRDDVGYFAKFTNPTIANGKVYVASWGDVPVDNNKCSGPTAPSNRGQLVVHGILSPTLRHAKTFKSLGKPIARGSFAPISPRTRENTTLGDAGTPFAHGCRSRERTFARHENAPRAHQRPQTRMNEYGSPAPGPASSPRSPQVRTKLFTSR
jgi:hypothetical protein